MDLAQQAAVGPALAADARQGDRSRRFPADDDDDDELGGQGVWWAQLIEDSDLSPEAALLQFRSELELQPDGIEARDLSGDTILHWSALHAQENPRARSINDWLLISATTDQLNLRYARPSGGGSSEGGCVLHILIFEQDQHALELLLARSGIRLDVRASGSVFDPGTDFYYGEFPLSCAVSTGWREGLLQLAAYAGADSIKKLARLQDTYGNTALHMAVLHRRKWEFDWLIQHAEADVRQKNILGFTAVSLAALCDNADMFGHVVSSLARVKWKFGRVTCSKLALHQIDTIRLHDDVDDQEEYRSVLEVVLMQHCPNVVVDPIVVALLQVKWTKFGRIAYSLNLVAQCAYLFALAELSNASVDLNKSGFWMTNVTLEAWEICVCSMTSSFLIMMLIDLFADFRVLRRKLRIIHQQQQAVHSPESIRPEEFRGRNWHGIQDSARCMTGRKTRRELTSVSLWDVLAWAGYVCLLAHFLVFKTKGQGVESNILLSLGVVIAWHSSLVFLFAWKSMGVLVLIILEVIVTDISRLAVLYCISIAGFAQGLRLLNVDPEGSFPSFRMGALSLFHVALGDKPDWARYSSDMNVDPQAVLAVIYFMVFTIFCFIILLRLLISTFNETYARVRKSAEQERRLVWSQGILRTERRLQLVLPSRWNSWLAASNSSTGHYFVFKSQCAELRNAAGAASPGKGVAQGSLLDDLFADSASVRAALMPRQADLRCLRAELNRLRAEPVRDLRGSPALGFVPEVVLEAWTGGSRGGAAG
ncbi:unnamed protein product [Polarella glacialis]|uniref:Ion transport domain-containing protein n=1 Tax=Polarella glacialis TaxID=89957 RepID=A0A813KL64_POLGL|nr:unnamed protein product [Polarella glacialis]